MQNIQLEAIEEVRNGAKFKINLPERSLKINHKLIIDHGKYEGVLGYEKATSTEEVLSTVETLYNAYRNSLPSERSQERRSSYFKALREAELSDDAMLYASRREEAQISLELYLLAQILLGFHWDTPRMGKWFWQSTQYPDLIILKKWIE